MGSEVNEIFGNQNNNYVFFNFKCFRLVIFKGGEYKKPMGSFANDFSKIKTIWKPVNVLKIFIYNVQS